MCTRLIVPLLWITSFLAAQVVPIDIARTIQLKDFPPRPFTSEDRWTHGYMAIFTRTAAGIPPEAWMYDRAGHLAIAGRSVWLPNIHHIEIQDAAPTPEGTMWISAQVWETNGIQPVAMMGELLPDGKLRWAKASALADRMCATTAGSLVALGGPLQERFDKTAAFDLLTRYHRDGRIEGTSIPYRSAPQLRYSDILRNSRVVTSTDGATGFYNGASSEWIEFDSTGKLVSRLSIPLPWARSEKAPLRVFHIVMNSTGRVYGWLFPPSNPLHEESGIFSLDRQKGQWVKESRSLPPGFAGIYGVDGDHLITRSGANTYAWFRLP